MPTVHIRLTGSADDTRTLMAALLALDDIEHVEEVADLMTHMDDEDSSSAGLSDDIGPGTHAIEIEAPHALAAERVRVTAERSADALGVPIEFIDEL
jgi:hypothetical protein